MPRLPRSFFNRPTLKVASELLGQLLVRKYRGRLTKVIITEVEAYIGQNDPACHACRGLTPRNRVMFGPPGHAYVYFIYGMYFCLNIVTEAEGFPAAVLIRGAQVPAGVSAVLGKTDGPGKLCRELKITKALNGIDLIKSDKLWVEKATFSGKIVRSPRIGIRQGTDKLWRFNLETKKKR
jgi:DNA-3-methyladenine glycosylase